MTVLSATERQFRNAMRAAGIEVKPVAWIDRNAALGEFAQLVVRTSQDSARVDAYLADQPNLVAVHSTKTRVFVALNMVCDYCPATEFTGSTCPTCQYDYR